MPRLLKDLQINDVSSVDRGAGEGVRVMLMKRHEKLPAEVEEYLKRTFSASERDAAASSGAALPDGSFPIKDKQDLSNAVRAIGRAKDPAKAKAHIKARAKALGATDMLPDSWAKRFDDDDNVIDMTGLLRKDGAVDFDSANELQESREAANGLMDELNDAICALSCSVNSIMCDDGVTNKADAVEESFKQFQDHLTGLAPMEKAMTAAAMTAEQITKQIAAGIEAAMKGTNEENAKLKGEIAVLKLSPAEQEFHKALTTDADKAAFIAKSAEDRAKDVEAAKKKAAEKPIDPAIQKRLDEAEADRAVLKNLQEKDQVATFEKRATDIGLPKEKGALLRKAANGDAAAFAEVEKLMGEMNKALDEARRTGKVFTEFGSNQSNVGKAYDLLKAKAEELRKSEAGKGLTEAQAFTKVYTDPANRELAEQEKTERGVSAQRAA